MTGGRKWRFDSSKACGIEPADRLHTTLTEMNRWVLVRDPEVGKWNHRRAPALQAAHDTRSLAVLSQNIGAEHGCRKADCQ